MRNRWFIAIMMAAMFAVGLPLWATSVSAQTHPKYIARRTSSGTVIYKRPNYYRRHRKLVNIGAGTVGGMVVGGLLGGRKGAVIGSLAGAGTGAIVTHKQRSKNYYRPVYRRRYRRP